MQKIQIEDIGVHKRIDSYLAHVVEGYSRSYFKELIKNGNVLLNGVVPQVSKALKVGDVLEYELEQKKSALLAENLPLDIVYEDNEVIIVNKAAGVVVHPACGHENGTLVNAVLGYAKGAFSVFLAHRIDKDTSGLVIIAKNECAKNILSNQFQKRLVKKQYLAVAFGNPTESEGYINAPLGRSPIDRKKIIVGPLSKKESITEFKVLKRYKDYCLLEVSPLTGRTHQIRSHLAYIGHPIMGDVFYGGPTESIMGTVKRQLLHAYKVSFIHPASNKRVEFTAPVPDDLKELCKGYYDK